MSDDYTPSGGNNDHMKWQYDPVRKEWVMPELQRKFLEEFLMYWPRPMKQGEWAQHHGLHQVTVSNWKKDPRFIAEWQKRTNEEHKSPEFVEPVLDNLHKIAQDPEHKLCVQAAKTLFDAIEKMSPKVKETDEIVIKDPVMEGITDDELAGILNDTSS